MNFGKNKHTTTSDSGDGCFRCSLCAEVIPFRATDTLECPQEDDDVLNFRFNHGSSSSRQGENRLSKEFAGKAVERCIKRVRRLRYGLLQGGVLLHPAQKFTARDPSNARIIAPLLEEEIEVGLMLGSGGFSSVYEVSGFQPVPDDSEALEGCSSLERQSRSFVMERAERPARLSQDMDAHIRAAMEKAEVPSYAIKHLKKSLVKDPVMFERAALDLAMEAQLLLSMDHPNIVALRGWTKSGVRGWLSGKADGFFFLMDRLPETLEDRIFQWRDCVQRYKNKIKKKSGIAAMWGKNNRNTTKQKYNAKLELLLGQRLEVLHDVASGIEYMHSKRIIYRDLKSANVGFDLDGVLKLFDFGLSRLLPAPKPGEHEESFEMSRVGTVNYMAPEVDARKPYHLSADVYSLGVLGWEILSMSSPREVLSESKGSRRSQKTAIADRCPLPICECWPQSVKDALISSMSIEPRRRPSATQFRLALEKGMHSLEQFFQVAKKRAENIIPTPVGRRPSFRVNLLTNPDGREAANGGGARPGSITGASQGGESSAVGDHSLVLGPNGHIVHGRTSAGESSTRSFYEEAKESLGTAGSTVVEGDIGDTSSEEESSSSDDNMDEDSDMEGDESEELSGADEESSTPRLEFQKIDLAGKGQQGAKTPEATSIEYQMLMSGQKRAAFHSQRSHHSEGRSHQDKRHHHMAMDQD